MKARTWLISAAIPALMQGQAAQNPRVVVLELELENSVVYVMDVDPEKRAVNANATPAIDTKAFNQACQIDDIVAVNGRPAKGLHFTCSWRMGFNPNPASGWGIADATISNSWPNCNWELLSKDGKFIGRFVDGGFFPHAVLGGAGAFLGARGEHYSSSIPGRPARMASAAEDPSQRRKIPGGGAYKVQYHLIPLFYPGIEMTANGPSIFHEDFSPVTASKPARAGEVLIVKARNLGPTTPEVRPGQAFPKWTGDPLPEVNADVEVTIGGIPGEVILKSGWPGEVGVYRIDFRMPAVDKSGTAPLQITAAWIPGDEVLIAVQP